MPYYDNYGGFPSYTPVSDRKYRMKRKLEKMLEDNPELKPIRIEGRLIAKTWWGKAWNENLEMYADYTNRLARGRSYIRTGAVFDLQIEKGAVNALVQGGAARPYGVTVEIKAPEAERLEVISQLCHERIEDLEELMEGRFPKELKEIFTLNDQGLFPTASEIKFACTCPDLASMCKHVVAVLYGIGARFDQDPTLFFTLRNIDFELFLRKTIEQRIQSMLKNADKPSDRILAEEKIGELFDL